MERTKHRGALPLSLGHRKVLSPAQADVSTGRLSGQQRQRGALADLDGAVAVRIAALPGFSEPVVTELYASVGAVPQHFVAQNRTAGVAQVLWDSRPHRPLHR